MSNVRIYELSKDLNKSNREILNVAKGLGISVKSHASSISDEEAQKIKDRIISSHGGEGASQKPVDDTEKVRVFRSEKGEEVVERRQGERVVIRRKKRQEEPEEEAAPVPPDSSTADTAPEGEPGRLEESPGGETVPEEEGQEEFPAEDEAGLEATDEESLPGETNGAMVNGAEAGAETVVARDGAKPGDKDESEESAKKNKKKVRSSRVKPKREEIIDEDTLEELRKAFRTKLPGRKWEYLVDDRRSKAKSAPHSFQRERGFDRGGRSMQGQRDQRTGGAAVDDASRVIPFPGKPSRRTVKIGESINLGELARMMGIKAGELIKKLISMGMRATVNQALDHETAALLAEEFDFDVSVDIFEEKDLLLEEPDVDENRALAQRPPVVTVMGHVDHGKTTLLDSIRQTNVVGGEAGGITQHIGAYSVDVDGRRVSFVDTPGHEAFTAMRARGAKVTDVVILVVAADDGVMPQTVEAVNHARAAEVPIIVAINKVDKPEANLERIKRQLADIGLISEEWGGDTLFAEVSAKQKTGIKELLELVLLQADILELKADRDKRANGFVIEAVLDKGRGPVATVIIREGTLRIGDYIVTGTTMGKVRALMDDKGKRVTEAGPSMPVEIMGISGVPEAGDRFYVVKDEKAARDVVSHRETKIRETAAAKERKPTLENLFESLEQDEAKELPLIVKADTQGSVEAVSESISKLGTEKCQVKIVHSGVGGITETDVVLASASNAIIVGFNVRPDAKALEIAEREAVSLELHSIIYKLIDRVRSAMEGLLDPIVKEKITAHAEIRETFSISRIGTIAGCMVTDGKVSRDNGVRVVRDGVTVFEGKLASLKRFKDDVKEVNAGYECGIGIERFNDVKVGDVLEFYTHEEFKQEL
ncbi:MAG: translation initiation factor IF-2 [Candidatus Dadabacteria bacterium]|nr:translation initiation factor IF-2 [Candidatus Dadabacteria bacterium]